MSKSRHNGDRLGNSKKVFENRSKRREIKRIIQDGDYEYLEDEEQIEAWKEPDFKHSQDR